MKNPAFATIIIISLFSCRLNNRDDEADSDPISVISNSGCDYMALIRHELDKEYSKSYRLQKVEVSHLSDQNENATSIWFAVNAEALFEDSIRPFEYAFFFERICNIEMSINLKEDLYGNGRHIRKR